MRKRKLCGIAGVLAFTLSFEMILAGCVTTTQVTFTSEAPRGELKYAVIKATSTAGDSVLQRFYAEYPREKYQIVACELVSKSWLPVVGGIGGALLGAAIGIPAAMDSDDLASGMGIGFGAPAIGTAVGSLLGSLFKDKYIVTYVEK
jgi:hypothetical protein